MPRSARIILLTTGLALGLACSGKSQSSSQTQAPPPQPAVASTKSVPDTSWVHSDTAGKTATLTLRTTRPASSPSALINGYRSGQAQIIVPVGWTVKWDWRNDDSGAAHSLVVMTQREKLPLEGGRAAFSNAMSRSVTDGLSSGQTDQTTFEAEEAGWYWLMCGVPSHALNGEWLELRVSPDARNASLQLKQK